eukprot:CAMPEP_0172011706 /NCGR_PEP_ID=MMETSP1041-20130122/8429_1 /TAXON_ID=464988 /ORGANISM="Hemiselmis andersenii, Strain CCMP439" /LENGTH=53 /DNA_ID=CAMNT_0012666197 /DNA_START=18 /DNA_END=179 /DNA_ORIENTATION=+
MVAGVVCRQWGLRTFMGGLCNLQRPRYVEETLGVFSSASTGGLCCGLGNAWAD